MDVDRRFFEGLMRDKELSLRALAKRMGLGHSQLSLTFSGDRKLQLDEAAQLSSIFGVPLSRIIQAMGVEASPAGDTRVTVVGRVIGDGTVTINDHGTVERTSAPAGVPDDGMAIQFRTAGTPLEWLDATVMFCAKPDGISPSVLGRLCLVQIKGGPMAVAAVRRGYAENSYNLSGPHSRDSAKLDWASVVLFSRH
jgi:transcriptional regulator with XRE-family HTH domain